jgi:hypothetical protein
MALQLGAKKPNKSANMMSGASDLERPQIRSTAIAEPIDEKKMEKRKSKRSERYPRKM